MTLTATERDLVDAASRWFDAHRAQFVDELCELLRYPSVSDESDPNPRPGAPYGPEV
ncbi:peptidase M20, partial [Bifidobacterium bifidum]